MDAKFPIGTRYKTRGKTKHLCTVTDILKTYNNAGELVKTRYVSTHEFLAQEITDHDVLETTIAMGLISDVKDARVAALVRDLDKKIDDQKYWIKTCGGDVDGYIRRYGRESDIDRAGDGGEAIFKADNDHLDGLLRERSKHPA